MVPNDQGESETHLILLKQERNLAKLFLRWFHTPSFIAEAVVMGGRPSPGTDIYTR